MLNDLMLYFVMALVVALIVLSIIHGAEQHKSYIATPRDDTKPKREETKPLRNQRAQMIWNRLNPKIYLDDDETEPLPQKALNKKLKQG